MMRWHAPPALIIVTLLTRWNTQIKHSVEPFQKLSKHHLYVCVVNFYSLFWWVWVFCGVTIKHNNSTPTTTANKNTLNASGQRLRWVLFRKRWNFQSSPGSALETWSVKPNNPLLIKCGMCESVFKAISQTQFPVSSLCNQVGLRGTSFDTCLDEKVFDLTAPAGFVFLGCIGNFMRSRRGTCEWSKSRQTLKTYIDCNTPWIHKYSYVVLSPTLI